MLECGVMECSDIFKYDILGQSRRPGSLKYRRNELLADLAASGRDRPHCPRQFHSTSNQQLTTRSTYFKHDAYKFSASYSKQKLRCKPHNFVSTYLPTSVLGIITELYIGVSYLLLSFT